MSNISSWWSDLINKWFPTPTITSFEAEPQIIIVGGTSLLNWKTDKAKSISISPSVGTVGADGTSVVAPIITTKYTLTASSLLGIKKATQDLTVTVGELVTTPAPTTPAPTTNVPPIVVKNGELWVGDLNINGFGGHPYPPAAPMHPAKPNEVHGEVWLKSIDSKNRYNIRGYIAEVMHLETRGTTPGSGTVQVMDGGGEPTKWYVI